MNQYYIFILFTGLRLFPQYTLVCSYCLQKCDSLEGLYAHKVHQHSLKPAFVCLRAKCGKKFDKVSLHVLNSHGIAHELARG